MKEELLHYVWRLKRFDLSHLQTTDGQPVDILKSGELNRDGGPDFLHAQLRIGSTFWAGNVEMHLRSSDWLQHQHSGDPAYDNVILHVVLEEDVPIFRKSGERIPCLELRRRIYPEVFKTYHRMLHNEHWIACQHQFHEVEKIVKRLWLDRLMVERLEKRSVRIAECLKANRKDWEQTFYQTIAWNFGVKANADAFEQLARAMPLKILAKHRDNLFQLEALLFGQAGMLEPDFQDEYPQKLQKEYRFLKQKYKLDPINPDQWKFLRMRPANFPTIRIAQLAMLIHQSSHLFSKVLAADNLKEIENMFELKISSYWQTHYLFDRESSPKRKSLGSSTIHSFVLNTIAPFLFLFGKERDELRFREKALTLLEETPAEENAIIHQWTELGLKAESALDSQALLQLKNNYCDKKRCLECAVGCAILKRAEEADPTQSEEPWIVYSSGRCRRRSAARSRDSMVPTSSQLEESWL